VVRGYREGVLVGAIVEGVGIVVHARCRGQVGLGFCFWRSSELIGARWAVVVAAGETWRGKRWEGWACRAWWCSGLTDYPSRFRFKLLSSLFTVFFFLRFGRSSKTSRWQGRRECGTGGGPREPDRTPHRHFRSYLIIKLVILVT
jgi:hypothetical protein